MVDDVSRCDYYKRESQNVKGRGYCDDLVHNNPVACRDSGQVWVQDAGPAAHFWGLFPKGAWARALCFQGAWRLRKS